MFLGQIIVLSRLNSLFSPETSARVQSFVRLMGIHILQRLAFGSVRDSDIVPKGWLSVLLGVYEASWGIMAWVDEYTQFDAVGLADLISKKKSVRLEVNEALSLKLTALIPN